MTDLELFICTLVYAFLLARKVLGNGAIFSMHAREGKEPFHVKTKVSICAKFVVGRFRRI